MRKIMLNTNGSAQYELELDGNTVYVALSKFIDEDELCVKVYATKPEKIYLDDEVGAVQDEQS